MKPCKKNSYNCLKSLDIDGKNYIGEFSNGKFNGQGTFTWSDGNKYVGEWKDGKMDGQGTLTFSSGEKYVGEWKDGKPWNGTGYQKNGNIIGTVVSGVKQQ